MAYRLDPADNSIVIDGWKQGIADSPYSGISNIRCANITSVPGEVSCNFDVQQVSPISGMSGTIQQVDTVTDTITYSGLAGMIQNYQAITFTNPPAGIVAGIVYYIGALNTSLSTFKVYRDGSLSGLVDLTGGPAGGTFASVNMGKPLQKTFEVINPTNIDYYQLDANGRVWVNPSTTGSWVFLGNTTLTNANGNGLLIYKGYLFIFRNALIDYVNTTGLSSGTNQIFLNGTVDSANAGTDVVSVTVSAGTLNNGQPVVFYGASLPAGLTASTQYYIGSVAGSTFKVYTDAALTALVDITSSGTGEFRMSPVYGWQTLNTTAGTNNPHNCHYGTDDVLYFCDGPYVGSLLQKVNQTFDPRLSATYTYTNKALLLPSNEITQCLAELGINLLVGGLFNYIYPWDRTSTSYRYPILISENLTKRIVTVNTNSYIFAGQRGRIYITNGSQAQLYKKVPDHISGQIEPTFVWQDAAFHRNQLFFGVTVNKNGSGTAINQYGGLWAIDLNTNALRLVNKLSYNTYAGGPTIIQPFLTTVATALGIAMYIGWSDGVTTFGIDQLLSTPYTNSQTTIDSDLIPIGTFQNPKNFNTIEYKLSQALVSGESIVLKARNVFDTSDVGYTTIFTDSTVGNLSNFNTFNLSNVQWIQIQAVLSSTGTNPTKVRLKEIRLR